MSIISRALCNRVGAFAAKATLLLQQASDSEEGRRTAAVIERVQAMRCTHEQPEGDLVDLASMDAVSSRWTLSPSMQRC